MIVPHAKPPAHAAALCDIRVMRNRSRIDADPDLSQTELGITASEASTDDADVHSKKNRAAAALGKIGGRKGAVLCSKRHHGASGARPATA
jgi:hypothetical protein